ncbi:hypothetical protein SeMB42_g03807 [Synchytrium endobioticum]|uniref:SEC7 domain-containing protein n=1 Tax=Synchytrium endobioticum TaxID=286115 RepID=A0A507D4B4_9FUNG|nr:hypothetical protein SeMB42_g03807 [Synchytrium endobioticum]
MSRVCRVARAVLTPKSHTERSSDRARQVIISVNYTATPWQSRQETVCLRPLYGVEYSNRNLGEPQYPPHVMAAVTPTSNAADASNAAVDVAMLRISLERLLAESQRNQKELRESLKTALQQLKAEIEDNHAQGVHFAPNVADRYWQPFKLGCSLSSPAKVREIALDGIQKLIAHNLLRGSLAIATVSTSNGSVPKANKFGADLDAVVSLETASTAGSMPSSPISATVSPPPLASRRSLPTSPSLIAGLPSAASTSAPCDQPLYLIDEIIQSVCAAFTGPSTDEATQLQILKVLLTAVTSTACEVHELSLIKVVQTCFNVHLHSRNTTNQVTAKASLTQMVNLIFSRMERYADVLAKSVEHGAVPSETGLHNLPVRSLGGVNESASGGGVNSIHATPADVSADRPPAPSSFSTESAVETTMKHASADENCIEDYNSSESNLDIPELAFKVSPPTPIIMRTSIGPPEGSLNDVALISGSHPARLDMSPYTATAASYNELLRRDVYVVLRLLCRLSMQSDEAVPMKPTTISTLELILSVMNNIGPILQSDELYVSLLRQSLCLSISRNAIATNPLLFELSLSVFLMLVRMYRAKLKSEIEVLLSTVFLHILEMGNSTYKQKSMVLQGLLKISENPQTLVDLYLNYDCDLSMISIFEKIVVATSRAAQGRDTPPPTNTSSIMSLAAVTGLDSKQELAKAQEKRLRLRGLCCLVAIMNALVEWTYDLAPNVSIVLPGGRLRTRRGTPTSTTRESTITRNSREVDAVSTTSNATTVVNEARSTEATRTSAASLSTENTTKSLREALAPTSQSNPVVVYKHPLHSVSMSNMPYNFVNSSTGSLRSESAATSTQDDDAGQVEELASRKLLLKQCVTLFNQKPVKGMPAIIQNGFVENDPVAIAFFLRQNSSLSKSAIGDYLGDGDPFSIKVMHAFIDSLDFTGQPFVAALRSFLQTFRLPGEAQKIDRIMEKYADKYCESNPDVFAKADTAYILAFSTIMLNTDQHSAQIKHRMDKAAFIKSNRGINDNADLPEEFLSDIFDEISKIEIVMEEEQADKIARLAQGWGAGELNERQRMELYKKEIATVTKKTAQSLANAGEKKNISPFRVASSLDLARSMFAVSALAFMSVFIRSFEQTADEDDTNDEPAGLDSTREPRVTDLCIQGLACAIRVAGIFRMETERDALVGSLAKITGLASPSTVRSKNIRALKTLIALANNLGEYLETSWIQVLKCASLLERLQVIVNKSQSSSASPNNGPGTLFMARRSNENKRSGDVKRTDVANSSNLQVKAKGSGGILDSLDMIKPSPALERLAAELQSQTTVVAVDRIFTSTVSLSASAILHFFRALCQVSAEEMGIESTVIVTLANTLTTAEKVKVPSSPTYTGLSASAPRAVINQATNAAGTASVRSEVPRIYLLSKIVEIAYYNMPRIRYEWTQIWRILQPHFSAAACHQDLNVATFAIDSLRQLSMKFLEREELGHYAAQSEFLRSFEWIIKHNSDDRIRELILGSMSQMIAARAKSIRSGWKSIFVVLAKGAQRDQEGKLAKQAFSIVHLVFKEYFDVVTNAGGFVDFVHCLAEFALLDGQGRDHEEMVMGSIQLLQYCAKHLARGGEHDKDESPRTPKVPDSSSESSPTLKAFASDANLKKDPSRISNSDISNSKPPGTALGFVSEEQFFLKWFPILSALSRVVIDSESSVVRGRALDALFDVLKVAGHRFEGKYWKNVYRSVVLPIFEDLRDPSAVNGRKGSLGTQKEGLQALWIQTLQQLVDSVTVNFDKLTAQSDRVGMLDKFEGLFQGVLDLTVSMMERRDDKLATTGRICFLQLFSNNITRFAKADLWAPLTDYLEKAFRITAPHELLNCEHVSSRKSSFAASQEPVGSPTRRTAAVESSPPPSASTSTNAVSEGNASTVNCSKSVNGTSSSPSPRPSPLAGASTPSSAGASAKAISRPYGSPPTPAQLLQAAAVEEGIRVAKQASGNAPPVKLEKLDFSHTIVKCGTHLELIQGIRDLCLSKIPDMSQPSGGTNLTNTVIGQRMAPIITLIPQPYQARWLACIHGSYCLARSFNADYELRHAIWRRGLVEQMPNLVKQETVAVSTLMRLMFAVYRARGDVVDPVTRLDEVAEQIASESCDVLERFVAFLVDQPRNARDINLWSPVVVIVLKELMAIESLWTASSSTSSNGGSGAVGGVAKCLALRRHLPRLFKLSVRVTVVDRAEVRLTLLEFLEKVVEEFLPAI